MQGNRSLVNAHEERDAGAKSLADEHKQLLDAIEELRAENADLKRLNEINHSWPTPSGPTAGPSRLNKPQVREAWGSTPASGSRGPNFPSLVGNHPDTAPKETPLPYYSSDPYAKKGMTGDLTGMEDDHSGDESDTDDLQILEEKRQASTSATQTLLSGLSRGVIRDHVLNPGRGNANPINPRTRGEWELIRDWIRDNRHEQMLKLIRQYRNAVLADRSNNSPLAKYVRDNWTNPAWSKNRVFDKNTGTLVETSNTVGSRAPKQSLPKTELNNLAESLGIPLGSELYHKLGNIGAPTETSHPYVWMRWFMKFLRHKEGGTPRGIDHVTTKRGALTLQENQLRAYLRIKPIFGKSTGDVGRVALQTALTILSIPDRYRNIVDTNRLSINTTPSWEPSQWETKEQASDETAVARVLAERGLSYIDALDAVGYAVSFLQATSIDTHIDEDLRARAAEAYDAASRFPGPQTEVYPENVRYYWHEDHGRWVPEPGSAESTLGRGPQPNPAATRGGTSSSATPSGSASRTLASSATGDVLMDPPPPLEFGDETEPDMEIDGAKKNSDSS